MIVKASDLAGNESRETAHILIPAPNATVTPLPTRRVEPVDTTGLVLAAKRRREEAMRRACRDEERAQAERVRAEAAAKNAAMQAAREQAKIQNYLQSKAALEAILQNPALSAAEKARIREEEKTKGAGSATKTKKDPKGKVPLGSF